jgi:hypothetical protein
MQETERKELIEIKHDAKILMKRAAKLLKEDKQEPIPFLTEAKEALEKRFAEIASGFNRPDYYKDITSAPEVLGSLYIPLKFEVCAEVAHRAYPGRHTSIGGTVKYWFLTKDFGCETIYASFGEYYTYLPAVNFYNHEAAEACLKLMQTKFFEGDVTI